ncbi:hypothetical protein CHU95_19605 [Niveispirillum lacus]|uniref:Flagellar hook-length control protein-like C-terminal domain-containing protein n=1 Tax=Niveispirillum lacus TaxID=1981099 RepID=A0A255YSE3_9PROT|nr:flagellar hook-length control protein FliK [Niveispirillum lacus]OYQ31370.1 hypothetical protein CHU95_19605 [Niveispirillum lacus]
MDVSTLFAAPNTAASTAALSLGALAGNGGNATATGDGLEGLDSFNQLLGNFLSLTGGELMAAATQGEPGPVMVGDGTAIGLTVPPGTATVPGSGQVGGMGMLAGFGAGGMVTKGAESRWAQSGLNLLAGGGLAGQELNPEVLEFLNDLSSVIATDGGLSDLVTDAGAVADGMPVPSGKGDSETAATETLIVLQGDTAPLAAAPALPATASPQVIPLTPAAQISAMRPGTGVMPLTTEGTGLQALPTIPEPDDRAIPVPPPVIPRLMDAGTQTALSVTAKPASVMVVPPAPAPAAPVTDDAVPSATTPLVNDEGATVSLTTASASTRGLTDVTAAAASAPASAPALTSPSVTMAEKAAAAPSAPTPATGTVTAAPGADDRPGALMIASELAITASDNDGPVMAPAPAAPPLPARMQPVEPVVPQTAAQLAMTAPATAPTVTSAELKPSATVPVSDPAAARTPAPTAADPDGHAQPHAALRADQIRVTATAGDSAAPAPQATQVTDGMAVKVSASTVPVAQQAVKNAKAPPVSPPLALTPTGVEPAPVVEGLDQGEPVTAEAPALTDAATQPAIRTPLTAAKPAPAPTQAKPAATPSQTVVTEDAATPVNADTDNVTNQQMLAPKHVNNEAQSDTQAEMTGPAQTAGQNTTASRPDTSAPTVNGEREDNLLSRAVTSAGKSSDAGSNSGQDAANGGGGTLSTADPADTLTGTLAGGEAGKTQGTDFAQSLRQTSTPHRPNAYMPPTHQMAMQVQRAVQEGNERLSIRLNPLELGRIDVQLEIGSEGKLRAKVMVENPQTLEMLQKDAKTLEKALQDAGLQTDQNSLSFSLQDSGDQAQHRQDQRDQADYGTAFASTEDEQEDPAILAQTQILELGRVDVRV